MQLEAELGLSRIVTVLIFSIIRLFDDDPQNQREQWDGRTAALSTHLTKSGKRTLSAAWKEGMKAFWMPFRSQRGSAAEG